MDQKKIGAFIQQIRKESSLTQRQLAEKLGVSDKTISKWECGNGLPDFASLKPLCDALGVSVNELLSGERLATDAYSVKAEENIMQLIKENTENKRIGILQIIVGLVLSIIAVFFSTFYFLTDGGKALGMYLDWPSLWPLLLFCAAGVLLSGAREKKEILAVIQRISIPAGLFMGITSSIWVLCYSKAVEELAVSLLSPLYGIIIYLIIIPIHHRLNRD